MEEIMDVVETMETEDVVEEVTRSGNGMKILGGTAIVGALAFGGYKLFKYLRKKKEEKDYASPVTIIDDYED